MMTRHLNDEEGALIDAFRLLTTRQRTLILTAAIGTASTLEPSALRLVYERKEPIAIVP